MQRLARHRVEDLLQGMLEGSSTYSRTLETNVFGNHHKNGGDASVICPAIHGQSGSVPLTQTFSLLPFLLLRESCEEQQLFNIWVKRRPAFLDFEFLAPTHISLCLRLGSEYRTLDSRDFALRAGSGPVPVPSQHVMAYLPYR